MYLVCKGGYSGSQTGFYLKDTSSSQVSLLLEDELFLDGYGYLFVNGITGYKVKEHAQSGTCTLTVQYIDYSGEFEEYEFYLRKVITGE